MTNSWNIRLEFRYKRTMLRIEGYVELSAGCRLMSVAKLLHDANKTIFSPTNNSIAILSFNYSFVPLFSTGKAPQFGLLLTMEEYNLFNRNRN